MLACVPHAALNGRAAHLQNEIAPEKFKCSPKNGTKKTKKDPKNDPKCLQKMLSPSLAT